jgi:hypothetical protein
MVLGDPGQPQLGLPVLQAVPGGQPCQRDCPPVSSLRYTEGLQEDPGVSQQEHIQVW